MLETQYEKVRERGRGAVSKRESESEGKREGGREREGRRSERDSLT